MPTLKFGMSFHDTANYDLKGVIQYARRVEELGFDSLWITENVHSNAEALESLTTLAVMASHTSRVSLGPSVLLLPLRNPVGLAHQAATIDRLSGGRLILGVGAGGNALEGFQAYGAPLHERGACCDEALQIITRLWTGKPVSHKGRLYNFENYALGAQPIQKPGPPIWVGGEAGGALRRLAKWCDGFVPHTITPQRYLSLWGQIEEYCEEFGRSPSEITRAMQFYYSPGANKKEAWRLAEEALSNRYKARISLPTDDDRRFSFGTARECIESIEAFVEIGVTHFLFSTTRPPSQALSTVCQFAQEILPHFK